MTFSQMAVVALTLGFVGFMACDFEPAKSGASLTYTEDAFRAYGEAMKAFRNKDWIDARALFSEVRKLFATSRYARLAELRIADIDFEQGKYGDAASGYRDFVKGHRSDENVEYAKYRISKALYLDIDDSRLFAPAEERDQANTVDAYNELKSFVDRFPDSHHTEDMGYMLEVVTQRLVRHELYVARYYLRRDNFRATIARVDYALKTYPGSGLDAEGLLLKGETLLKMHAPERARQVLELVIRAYGGPFARVAKRFLSQMNTTGESTKGSSSTQSSPQPSTQSSAPGLTSLPTLGQTAIDHG